MEPAFVPAREDVFIENIFDKNCLARPRRDADKSNILSSTISPSSHAGALESEVEDLGLGGHIDQVRPPIQRHVGEKLGLIEPPVFGARRTDSDLHLMLHQIRDMVVGTVSGGGLYGQIPCLVRPHDAAIYKEEIYRMALGMGDFCKLKTSGRSLVIVFAQNEQEIGHTIPPSWFVLPHEFLATCRAGIPSARRQVE